MSRRVQRGRFMLGVGMVAAVAALELASGRDAGAVPEFPGDIAAHEGLDYTPPCRLCHIHGTTGTGSVQTPFGISMLAHGLTRKTDSLYSALDALAADSIDSDGDGVGDIAELEVDTDPNTPVDVALTSGSPSYGCSSSPRPPDLKELLEVCACWLGLFGLRFARRNRERTAIAIGQAHRSQDGVRSSDHFADERADQHR
jgi:hypothetical protein